MPTLNDDERLLIELLIKDISLLQNERNLLARSVQMLTDHLSRTVIYLANKYNRDPKEFNYEILDFTEKRQDTPDAKGLNS